MKNVAIAALFGVAAFCFQAAYAAAPAYLFVAAASVAAIWRGPGLAEATAVMLRRLLFVSLAATVLYGWFVMVYPVLSTESVRSWSLVLGYTLGSVGSVFVLCRSAMSVWSTTIPAAAALLVVASFRNEAEVHAYLVVAGVTGFVYLAIDSLPSNDDRRWQRIALLGVVAVSALALGTAIVVALPWTQSRVEETMMTIYTPSLGGSAAQHRARLGELQQLKLSKKVVMRVWSERPQRLRSRVLVHFDGTGWSRDAARFRELAPAEVEAALDEAARDFVHELPGADFVTLPEKLHRQRLIQTKVVRVDGGGLATPGGSYLVRAPIDKVHIDSAAVVLLAPRARVRVYGVLHDVNHQRVQEAAPDAATREASLELPKILDPRIRDLAARLAEGASGDETVVERVVAHLREDYSYSLNVGNGGAMDRQDPIADFLFRKREGWCEYFAASAAVLLRTQGIPTRYVRGFNVIGSQKKGDHYVVREWDRHAWIEAFIEGKGWLEYDPTPAAEYEALHAALDDGFVSEVVEWLRAFCASLYASLRHFDGSLWVKPGMWLLILTIVGWAVARRARLRLPGRRASSLESAERPEVEQLLRELDAAVEKLGWPRPKSRAPLEHWTSLPLENMPISFREAGARIIEGYYHDRFGGASLESSEILGLRQSILKFKV